MKFDVLVSGMNVVDLLLTMPASYKAGHKHQVDEILIQGGAPAGNAACGMASLGLSTAFLGFLGNNPQSNIAKGELERCGVVTDLMLSDDTAVPATALVQVDPDNGDRTVFYTTNGYRALSPMDIDDGWLASTKLVFVDGYDIEGNLALLEKAKALGLPSVVDMEAGDRGQLMHMLKLGGHVILPLEAAQFLAEEQLPETCLRKLSALTDGQVVITDGANGSWALDDDELIQQRCFPVEVVDTTGCGDAYHASYAYGLLKGFDLAKRMQFASGFAAIVATHFGGRTRFPSEEQVWQFIQNYS